MCPSFAELKSLIKELQHLKVLPLGRIFFSKSGAVGTTFQKSPPPRPSGASQPKIAVKRFIIFVCVLTSVFKALYTTGFIVYKGVSIIRILKLFYFHVILPRRRFQRMVGFWFLAQTARWRRVPLLAPPGRRHPSTARLEGPPAIYMRFAYVFVKLPSHF